jgi:hypothetical protein
MRSRPTLQRRPRPQGAAPRPRLPRRQPLPRSRARPHRKRREEVPLAGLLVWTPLAITVWVLSWLLGAMDGLFAWLLTAPQALLPASAHASIERLRHVPGLGVLVMGSGCC